MRKLSDIGEIGMLERLRRNLPVGRGVLVGAGDDCAVATLEGLAGGRAGRWDLLLTSDPVIENIHFTPQAAAGAVGHKALGRVLSDIAAMGGEPLWALVNVVAPARTRVARLSGIYKGIAALARRHGVSIAGGDIARGAALELHVFCVGRVRRGKAVLRSGAKPGDMLFVTGSLGGSRTGRHVRFEPRLKEGRWLSEHGWASAMIDVSDGLASDVRRLAASSGTGAQIRLDSIPVSSVLSQRMNRRNAALRALSDGEDYELLFTVPAGKAEAFIRVWRKKFELSCACIGRMTAGRGHIECLDGSGRRSVLKKKGYEHFA